MGKCLVTKLMGIVNNDSLKKMGELIIHVNSTKKPTQVTQSIVLRNPTAYSLRIVGNGYFTDSNLTANKGKVLPITSPSDTTVYFSNGDYDIFISTKYSMQIAIFNNCSVDLDEFKYSNNVEQFVCSRASGSLKSISKPRLSKLSIRDASRVNGTFSDLKGLAIGILTINNITGIQNIEDLKAVTSSGISIQNSTIIGDVAVLNNNVQFISFGAEHNANLTWSNRNTEGYIIALEGIPTFANVDTMLIGQAKCKATTSEQANYKIISAKGTRTSASDAAVQTLQSKGYTVSITPA